MVTAALADEPSGRAPAAGYDPVISGLVDGFIGWISAQSNLEPCTPPAVTYATNTEIAQRWYGNNVTKGNIVNVLALYVYPTKTIYLSTSFDSGALLDKSILLHEIAHHLQDCNEVEFPCHAASEPRAYELQARWLEGQGVNDAWGLMGLDRFSAYAYSICPE